VDLLLQQEFNVYSILTRMQSSRLLSWSRYVYLAGVVSALVFIIPSVWFPLQLGKVTVFAVFLGVSAILFVLGGGMRELCARGSRVAWFVSALPLAYLASLYFSTNQSIGLSGYVVDTDTVLFVLLCSIAFIFSFTLFKTLRAARLLLWVAASSAAFAVLFQYVTVLFGTTIIPFQIFTDRSVNVVGKWNDLGVLVGLLLMLVLLVLEFVPMSRIRRVAGFVLLAALALLLAIIQFPLVWWVVMVLCLLLAAWSFVSKWQDVDGHWLRTIPWVPVVGAVISGLLLLWGATVNTGLTTMFPVSALEVRPAFSSTLDITRASHGTSLEKFLVGTGPQTFGQSWLLHKPMEVNQSPFWNLDFSVGFSTFTTALASVGVLGALAWIIPLMLVWLGLLRALRSQNMSAPEKVVALCLGTSAVFLWTAMLFYVPSQNSILLSFTLAGAAFGFCMKKPNVHGTSTESSRAAQVGFGILSLCVVGLVLWGGFTTARRFMVQSYINQGAVEMTKGDVDQALVLAAKAQKIEPVADSYRLAVAARTVKIQQIASIKSPTQEDQEIFKDEVEKVIVDGQRVITIAPQDYRGYVALARVYDLLATLGVSGAYDNAKDTYNKAAVLNPTSPEIPLLLARLEAGNSRDLRSIETNLSKSLTLKPDYTDAILFLVQLNVANKDMPNAIKAAQAAVRSAPGVPSIWFELGLLYYTSKDIPNALPVLEQAVKLQPDFANAKYFLGLAYAAQNRIPEALQQFVDLEKTNPDNEEVKFILGNLRSGKSPFENAQPPVTDAPEARQTAPIAQ